MKTISLILLTTAILGCGADNNELLRLLQAVAKADALAQLQAVADQTRPSPGCNCFRCPCPRSAFDLLSPFVASDLVGLESAHPEVIEEAEKAGEEFAELNNKKKDTEAEELGDNKLFEAAMEEAKQKEAKAEEDEEAVQAKVAKDLKEERDAVDKIVADFAAALAAAAAK